MSLKATFYFRLCKFISDIKLRSKLSKDTVYITFDDGPEPAITEYVLDTLKKYGATATFFCCGKNCERYPVLFDNIKQEGHVIANHTYSHINGLYTNTTDYISDVNKCNIFTKSVFFRPPWGGATIYQYFKLRQYTFVYWDVLSGDTELKGLNLTKTIERLSNTKLGGKVVLFHFCKLHEAETRLILPAFLEIVKRQNLKCQGINVI